MRIIINVCNLLLLLFISATATTLIEPTRTPTAITWTGEKLGCTIGTGKAWNFQVYRADDRAHRSHYALVSVFELTDCYGGSRCVVPGSRVSLRNCNWSVSDVTCSEGVAHFSFSTGRVDGRWEDLRVIVHLQEDSSSSEIKFDLVIEGYNWWSQSPTASLGLKYSIGGYKAHAMRARRHGRIHTPHCSFDPGQAATIQPLDDPPYVLEPLVDLQAPTGLKGPEVVVSWEHFPGGSTLHQDPTLSLTEPNRTPLWVVGGICLALGIIVLVLWLGGVLPTVLSVLRMRSSVRKTAPAPTIAVKDSPFIRV
eukprot:gnl/Dysnectes_brevis/9558_a17873_232.p1 GENE.gnl/Dysnectes_brevis/9558_a17873_232~~gnl/Dysnectes_brevis/9558_a17873_232.p1  ORF type:complete len:309 (-),score=69.16 gnl/Dysnectes_brevis/9558_a17873_232:196-1122(-)